VGARAGRPQAGASNAVPLASCAACHSTVTRAKGPDHTRPGHRPQPNTQRCAPFRQGPKAPDQYQAGASPRWSVARSGRGLKARPIPPAYLGRPPPRHRWTGPLALDSIFLVATGMAPFSRPSGARCVWVAGHRGFPSLRSVHPRLPSPVPPGRFRIRAPARSPTNPSAHRPSARGGTFRWLSSVSGSRPSRSLRRRGVRGTLLDPKVGKESEDFQTNV